MPHQRVEKCESPRTGSATRAALAHAVPSRMTAVPRSGSPHLGSNLPPYVGRRCTCAMPHQCVEKPKVAKLPAPSRHRSPTLSHTVRGHGHTPAAVSRWSKNRSRPPPGARANMCASIVGVTGYPRYGRGPRRRALAPRHSRTLCAATVTLPPPFLCRFLGGRKIDHVHRPRQHVCKCRCDRIPKVRTWPAPSRHRSPTLSHTVRGHGHTPAAVSRWSKSWPCRPPAPTCVQASSV